MEVHAEKDYFFQKVFLFAPGQPKMRSSVPFGAADIEILDRKGVITCRVRDLPSVFTPRDVISLLICSRGGDEPLVIGQLQLDKAGIGECKWDFNILNVRNDSSDTVIDYELVVIAEPEAAEGGQKGNYVLLKGVFSLIHEIRDSRVLKL